MYNFKQVLPEAKYVISCMPIVGIKSNVSKFKIRVFLTNHKIPYPCHKENEGCFYLYKPDHKNLPKSLYTGLNKKQVSN